MDTWFDHLTATIMAGAVILILATVWYRTQVSAVATTNTYRDRAFIETVRDVVDRDMTRLGAGVDPSEDAIVGYDWTGPTRSFEFRGEIAAAGTVDRVRYLVTEATCTTDAATCWRLRRQVHDGTAYVTHGLDLVIDSVAIALDGAPAASATGVNVHVVLEAPQLRPATTAGDPRRLPVSFARYYRLVNQTLRSS